MATRRDSADGQGHNNFRRIRPTLKSTHRTERKNVFPGFIKILHREMLVGGLQCHQPHRRQPREEEATSVHLRSGTIRAADGYSKQKARLVPGDYHEVYALGTNRTMLRVLPNSPAPSGRPKCTRAPMGAVGQTREHNLCAKGEISDGFAVQMEKSRAEISFNRAPGTRRGTGPVRERQRTVTSMWPPPVSKPDGGRFRLDRSGDPEDAETVFPLTLSHSIGSVDNSIP